MFKPNRAAALAVASMSLLAASVPAASEGVYVANLDTQFASGAGAADFTYRLTGQEGRADRDLDVKLPYDFSTPAPAGSAEEALAGNAGKAPRNASLAALVSSHDGDLQMDRQLECLATAVYHESKGEPLEGQLAVAQVVMNRVDSGRFADSICGVVYQPKQFSFVETSPARRSASAWQTAVAVARIARDQAFRQVAPDALFFHANYAKPSWRMLKQKVAAVGAHTFYR